MDSVSRIFPFPLARHQASASHAVLTSTCRDFVVDAKSAGPQLPGVTYYSIEATHSAMCKFASMDAPGYSNVSSAILRWVVEAPESIQTRWRVEEEERTARARNELTEIAKHTVRCFPSPLSTPFHPFLIHFKCPSVLSNV